VWEPRQREPVHNVYVFRGFEYPRGDLRLRRDPHEERAVQHQVRDAFRVTDRLLDHNGPSLRDADQREAVDMCRFHHCFEVSHLRGQGQVGRTSSALRVKRMLLQHQACAALLLQVHLIDRQSSLCCDHFDERVLWRPRQ
jgi:hypothetical protein